MLLLLTPLGSVWARIPAVLSVYPSHLCPRLAYSSILKMEAARFSLTPEIFYHLNDVTLKKTVLFTNYQLYKLTKLQ
jgi:hypothetical protein